MHPYQVRNMSAPWQMVCPVQTPGAGSTCCRHANYCNARTWQTWSLAVYLPGAATLKCCCPQQTYLQTTADRSGPQQHAALECDNTQVPPTVAVLLPLWSMPWSLLVTWPQPSTCISRGPWNGSSRLPPQHQPLSPSAVCWGENHHWQPWGLCLQTGETEDPLRPEGMDSAIPALMATLTQMSLWLAMLGDTPSFTCVTQSLLQPTMPKTPEAVSMCTFPPGLSQLDWQISYFLYRRKWIWP